MANISYLLDSQFAWDGLSHREQMEMMDYYYDNNSLYEAVRLSKYYLGMWNENIRPLRTPVNRSVEFYVSKVAVGDPIISVASKNKALEDAISNVMEWSNFQIVKPVQIRSMSKYGDLFRKVVSENGKVWHEEIETEHVADFKEDVRGFLTEIRIDTPIVDNGLSKTRTEFWTVNENLPYMAVWEHSRSEGTPLSQLGDPILYVPLSVYGIDFIPFTRTPFRNLGEEWGANCVQHALLKVDEANRQATRLHQMLFRYGKPTWAVSANQVSPDGTPMSAPKLKQGTNANKTDGEIRDDSILYLPGNSTIESLVPNINYEAALNILLSQEKELEKDLPELLYYSIPERSDLSGKALRTLLGAAVDRASQAQNNFVEGTVRLNQMAITIGQFQGIFPSTLGSFDSGDLNHSIRFQDPFPVDPGEKATTLQAFVTAGMPLIVAMKFAGFSEEEIDLLPKVDTASTPQ